MRFLYKFGYVLLEEDFTYGLAARDQILAEDAGQLTRGFSIVLISNLAHQSREKFVLRTRFR